MDPTTGNKFEELDKLLNSRWKIYIDSCSLCATTKKESYFWDTFIPILEKNNCKFTITNGTYEEIKRHKHDDNPENANLKKQPQILKKFWMGLKKIIVTLC